MTAKKKAKKAAKKVTKKVIPKPSTLLANALALFGPKGDRWITGVENSTRDAGYIDTTTGSYVDKCIVEQEIVAYIPSIGPIEEMEQAAADMQAKARELKKRYQPVEECETYCSIGAIHEINTPNADEAAQWLAAAIDSSYAKAFKISDKDERENALLYLDGAESIIMMNNDNLDEDDKNSFPQIKKWFTKAIKMAKAAGR